MWWPSSPFTKNVGHATPPVNGIKKAKFYHAPFDTTCSTFDSWIYETCPQMLKMNKNRHLGGGGHSLVEVRTTYNNGATFSRGLWSNTHIDKIFPMLYGYSWNTSITFSNQNFNALNLSYILIMFTIKLQARANL